MLMLKIPLQGYSVKVFICIYPIKDLLMQASIANSNIIVGKKA